MRIQFNTYEKEWKNIALKANKHNNPCSKSSGKHKGCLDKNNNCKVHFPREIVSSTMVDINSDALKIKKGEKWYNTQTPTLFFLLHCNHDTTSLLSGTAVKAIVAYVTDYVIKPVLKTHVIFGSM